MQVIRLPFFLYSFVCILKIPITSVLKIQSILEIIAYLLQVQLTQYLIKDILLK